MTPLKMARQRKQVIRCINCPKLVQIGNVFYCEESGKILLPQFLEAKYDCSMQKGNEGK
jgi:hypothetical protein